jgi:hypothetical protein
MTHEQLNKRLRWLVLERITLDERGAAAEVLERNDLETIRVQRRLSFAFPGPRQPGRVA